MARNIREVSSTTRETVKKIQENGLVEVVQEAAVAAWDDMDNHWYNALCYFGLGDIDLPLTAVTEEQIEEFNLPALPDQRYRAIYSNLIRKITSKILF